MKRIELSRDRLVEQLHASHTPFGRLFLHTHGMTSGQWDNVHWPVFDAIRDT